jgi:hypothetical protein
VIHYHGTPITPRAALEQLAGRFFCISHARPDSLVVCDQIGQGLMLDNGAFSAWTAGRPTNWPRYYDWTARWLQRPTTWAVVPDVIDAPEEAQDALLRQWPHGKAQAAPVWHMNESLERLLRLVDEGWFIICVGSTAQFRSVGTPAWARRMDQVWAAITLIHGAVPRLHMLRGMKLSGQRWPFYSVDSTDIARNHHIPGKDALTMAHRWDATQGPATWRSP